MWLDPCTEAVISANKSFKLNLIVFMCSTLVLVLLATLWCVR